MKLAASAAALLLIAAPAVFAQTAQTAPAPAQTAAVAIATKFNLDTPIETIIADPAAKVALYTVMPDIDKHPSYDMFKAMSLNDVQPHSNGQVTDEMMKKAEAALATVK